MKKFYKLLGVITIGAAIGTVFTGCPNPSGGNRNEGEPQTAAYISTDSDGNRYTLEITENTSRVARYIAQTGDRFELTVELINNGTYTLALTYSGTIDLVQSNGAEITLSLSVNDQPLDITISGTTMTVITGTISLDNGEMISAPGGVTSLATGVYIAGGYSKTDDRPHAGYWRDGIWFDLEISGSTASNASGITVSDADIYIAGMYTDAAGTSHTGYWKNGTWTELAKPDGSTEGISISGIAVSGSNVYVAATRLNSPSDYHAGYWQNETWFNLSERSGIDARSMVNAVAVSGNNVCFGGICDTLSGQAFPSYWLNGARSDIDPGVFDDGNAANGGIRDIALYGTTVHAVGWGPREGQYWVNGTAQDISADSAYCVAVSGFNVYIAGSYFTGAYNRGFLHVGGNWVSLVDPEASTQLKGMIISDGAFYIIGNLLWQSGSYNTTAYWWRNSSAWQILPAPSGSISSWTSGIAMATE
jgi:hypothetical protein